MPASGTMAHSYIEAFPDEEAAFRAFARAHPGPVTFLVDTYDTLGGVATASRVLNGLRRGPGCAIRLDSGDLGALVPKARAALDAAGLRDVAIIASGGLDEYGIDALVRSGAPVDVYAVGTRVGTSADAPYLDSAYKLVEYDGRPVIKLSSAKVSAPGRKQVFRTAGQPDLITLWDEPPPAGAEPLLRTVMRDGRRTGPPDDLATARARLAADVAALSEPALRVHGPEPSRPRVSRRLSQLTTDVRRRLRAGMHNASSRDGSRGEAALSDREEAPRGVRATKNRS